MIPIAKRAVAFIVWIPFFRRGRRLLRLESANALDRIRERQLAPRKQQVGTPGAFDCAGAPGAAARTIVDARLTTRAFPACR